MGIVRSKKAVRWYIGLKVPTCPQRDKIINTINNEYKEKWTNYNNTFIFFDFQIITLLIGFLTAISHYLDQYKPDTLWIVPVLFLILFLAIVHVILIIYVVIIVSKVLRLTDIVYKMGYWSSLAICLFLYFLANIPLIYIIYRYNVESNFNNSIPLFGSIFLFLTIGLYESIKHILSFFLPVSANGLYSIEELIQEEMIKEKCIAH
jgi:hypothetical protein